MRYVTATPAYGVDYTSAKAVRAAWNEGRGLPGAGPVPVRLRQQGRPAGRHPAEHPLPQPDPDRRHLMTATPPVQPGTWMARHVRPGWTMEGAGIVLRTFTHTNGQITFTGTLGYRTFALDALVEATPRADFSVGDRVAFNARTFGPGTPLEGTPVVLYGTVFRPVWGRVRAQNVSIRTDDGRTYVRLVVAVTPADLITEIVAELDARPNWHPEGDHHE